MSGYHRQHVVSRVLLARFADPTGTVRAVDLGERRDFVAAPIAVGAISDFISHERLDVEQRWAEIEDRVPRALEAVDAGTALEQSDVVTTLKNLVALHWGRSRAMHEIYEKGIAEVLDAQQIEMLRDPALHDVFQELTGGLVAVGPGALEYAAEQMRHRMEDEFDTGQFFAERVIANVDEANRLLHDLNLEIMHTDDGEFLISDNPAATLRGDRTGVGPLGGVPWGDADAVMLPLGPKHVLGVLTAIGEWHEITADQAAVLNVAQLRSSVRHVFLRPDGALFSWIRAALGWDA